MYPSPPREMISFSKEYARSKGLLQKSEVHGQWEWKIVTDKTFAFENETSQETSTNGTMTVQDWMQIHHDGSHGWLTACSFQTTILLPHCRMMLAACLPTTSQLSLPSCFPAAVGIDVTPGCPIPPNCQPGKLVRLSPIFSIRNGASGQSEANVANAHADTAATAAKTQSLPVLQSNQEVYSFIAATG